MWDTIKHTDIHKMGFPEGEEYEKEAKRENKLVVKTFNEITKN